MTIQSSKIEASIQQPTIAKSFEFPAWLPWFLTRLVSGYWLYLLLVSLFYCNTSTSI